jgi:hypothetical protein
VNAATEAMTAELAAELASNERRLVDPRTMPARFHNLKAIGLSPAHCLASFQERTDRESLAIRMGSGVHALLFDQPIAVYTGKVRNGKVWDAFKTDNADKCILSRKEHSRARAIADSVRRHPDAAKLLFCDGAIHEDTILWEQLGRARRSTPDCRGSYGVVELKTTRCAEPGRFVRDGMFRAYHAQLADQMDAIEYATGKRPEKAYIVAIESVAPYAVTVLELTDRALERGRALVRMWLERLLVCEAANAWPAYRESIDYFDVPDDEIDLVFANDADETEGDEP